MVQHYIQTLGGLLCLATGGPCGNLNELVPPMITWIMLSVGIVFWSGVLLRLFKIDILELLQGSGCGAFLLAALIINMILYVFGKDVPKNVALFLFVPAVVILLIGGIISYIIDVIKHPEKRRSKTSASPEQDLSPEERKSCIVSGSVVLVLVVLFTTLAFFRVGVSFFTLRRSLILIFISMLALAFVIKGAKRNNIKP